MSARALSAPGGVTPRLAPCASPRAPPRAASALRSRAAPRRGPDPRRRASAPVALASRGAARVTAAAPWLGRYDRVIGPRSAVPAQPPRAVGDAVPGVPDDPVDGDASAKPSVWYGRALLVFVAAAYGSLSVAFKYVYGMPGPPSAGVIGAVRGVFAALCFVPMIVEEAGKNRRSVAAGPARDESSIDRSADRSPSIPADDTTFWRAAGELALWNLVAQGACNVALLFTDATRVSFLTQTSIAFTPILVAITGGRVGAATWAGCALAVAGVVALGLDGGSTNAAEAMMAGAAAGGLNVGDVIALVGAASYSLYIFRIGAFAREGLPGNLTQAWKTVILSALYLGWAAFDFVRHWQSPASIAAPWAGWTNPLAWLVLIFTAVVPGYLADVCQAKGQESVAASESQVLLAGEPLFAAVLGAVLLGESLGAFGYVGGAGLVAGAILTGLDEGDSDEDSDGGRAEDA